MDTSTPFRPEPPITRHKNRAADPKTVTGAIAIVLNGADHSPTVRAIAWRYLLATKGRRFNGQRILMATMGRTGGGAHA